MPVYQFPLIFPSGEHVLVGRAYRDVDNLVEARPTMVVTGSWLTVKEQMPHTYALALAERGITAFTFDFTGFGESTGEPRQLEHPARKIQDIIAAAEFLSTMSFVQGGSPGHLAVCASAQYALAAIARGARIRCFASVAGWFHDAMSVAPFYGGAAGTSARLDRARKAVEDYVGSRTVTMVPAYRAGDERAGMFFELDYYANPQRGAVPAWKNEMAEMSWQYWLTFDGLRAAREVTTPTVMVHSDGCALPDNAKRVFAALRGPKRLEWSDGSQTDFYDQPAQVSAAADLVDEFVRTALLTD